MKESGCGIYDGDTTMARKQRRISRRMLFTWLLLGGLILLFTPQRITNKLQFAFARVFSWPLSAGRSITLSTETSQQSNDFVSRREYEQLNNHYHNVVQQRDHLLRRLNQYAGLKQLPVWERANFVLADIITASYQRECELIINRGREDAIAAGQYVLADNSVIGIVSDVSMRTAKVRLLTDPDSKIAVRIEGGKTGRLMQGCGNNLARVRLLKERVEVGEKVLAGEKYGYLDCAMVAGNVVKCERNQKSPLLWDIIVEPACDMHALTSVAVVVMRQ